MKNLNALLLLFTAWSAPTLFGQAGTLDNSFSTDGLISTDVGAATFDQGRAVAIQEDGRIVVVGTTGYSKALDFGAARYLPDGTPDPEFSFNGVDFTSVVVGDDHATSVVIQPDGKILIGGYGFCTEGNCFAMVRYLSDGAVDPEFGLDGIVTTEISGGYVYESEAIALQDDGKILLAGGGVAGFAVVRYFEDGSIDTDFGNNGLATCAFGQGSDRANGIAVLEDGKIILSGYSSNAVNDSIAVTRLLSDGTIDTDFGIGGRARAALPGSNTIGQGLALGPNGELIIVGYHQPQFAAQSAMAARFTPEGVLDVGFNGTGLRDLAVPGSTSTSLRGVAVQPDGKVIACGTLTTVTGDLMVVRLNADGSDDITFNATGLVTTDFTGTSDIANAVTLQNDGRIVVVGRTNAFVADYNFAVARYLSDGNVGLADPEILSGAMQVFPQPATSNVTIAFTLSREDMISIELYDARGALVQRVLDRQLRTAGAHQQTLQLPSDLSAGLYMLTLRGRAVLSTAKVVVD